MTETLTRCLKRFGIRRHMRCGRLAGHVGRCQPYPAPHEWLRIRQATEHV